MLEYGAMRELAALWTERDLLSSVARHELRRAYAGTAAGVAWSVLMPLVPLVMFTVVFSFGLRLPLGRAPYAFGFAAGYVPWVLLSSAIAGAVGSIVDHAHLVKRVRFPIQILPAGSLLVESLPHALLVTLTAIACAAAGYARFPAILFLLYFYLCAAVLIVGIGLFLSGLTVLVRDVRQAIPPLINVWFWVTPVAWASSALPSKGRVLLSLNPAAYIVSGYRHALMPQIFAAPGSLDTITFWCVTIAILLTGSMLFRRLRPHFWECL